MNRFKQIQKKLDELSPIPSDIPKLYLIGDTGAGKTTIVRKILGTDKDKFPLVQQTRTTVAVTEYVLSKNLPFKASYIFRRETEINEFIQEILEKTIEEAYSLYCKDKLNTEEVVENLGETRDQRFRLRYILDPDELNTISKRITNMLLPELHNSVNEIKKTLGSNEEEEIETIVDLALDSEPIKSDFSEIKKDIISLISEKVAKICSGHELFSTNDTYQHSEQKKDEFIKQVKRLLSSTKESISPVIEHARLEGNLLAEWLPDNTKLILIDGEGIGHDTREASSFSTRHLDYFYFADSICLVEESKKPFASGGKSVIEGIITNGYSDKFKMIFSKLDEVEVDEVEVEEVEVEVEENKRKEQVKRVKKGLKNIINALESKKLDPSMIKDDNVYYLSKMKDEEPDSDSVSAIKKLIEKIRYKFDKDTPQFFEPIYDYEMLSSYFVESSDYFIKKWNEILDKKSWQTIKAFNRRMCWKWDEFNDMKPISDFHSKIMKELEKYISDPKSWAVSVTASMQDKSINRVKREFSKALLDFSRKAILDKYSKEWKKTMSLKGKGSTYTRRSQIKKDIIQKILPNHKKTEAITFKDDIKKLLIESVEECKKQ